MKMVMGMKKGRSSSTEEVETGFDNVDKKEEGVWMTAHFCLGNVLVDACTGFSIVSPNLCAPRTSECVLIWK